MYYLLTESFKDQEKKIVDMIIRKVKVDKIYFLGSTRNQQRTESIFMPDAPSIHSVGHYFILVLFNNREMSCTDLQDRIENICRAFIPVTAIVMRMEAFEKHCSFSHDFARVVLQKAVVLYDRTNVPFAASPAHSNAPRTNTWKRRITMANEFMTGAELYISRRQKDMAVFMLHQALENSLNTYLKIITGWDSNSHNIDKLLRYCTMINYKIGIIFPRNTEIGIKIRAILQKAYVDTRYKEGLEISNGELLLILEKTKEIQKVLLEIRV